MVEDSIRVVKKDSLRSKGNSVKERAMTGRAFHAVEIASFLKNSLLWDCESLILRMFKTKLGPSLRDVVEGQ